VNEKLQTLDGGQLANKFGQLYDVIKLLANDAVYGLHFEFCPLQCTTHQEVLCINFLHSLLNRINAVS
jgi:hypothetical protein